MVSAKGYDAWGAAATPARYHKVSLFPEATNHSPGNAELRCAFWSALDQVNPDVVAVNGWNNFGSLAAANCEQMRLVYDWVLGGGPNTADREIVVFCSSFRGASLAPRSEGI